MTNWKQFKIICTPATGREREAFEYIVFGFKKYYEGSNGKSNVIFCADRYPFNTWKVGDWLEIDLDKIHNYNMRNKIDDTNVVRKFSEVVGSSSSNQQITSNQIQERDERMRRWVEESGGEYEADFIARQEYRTDGSVNAHELKWTYRKK